MNTFKAQPILNYLKDFQRATAEYVFERMYLDDPPAHRYLVADEVGLGKTLVARGVIAKTIEHLQRERVKRIDIVYVCSNAQIAKQNVRRLQVGGDERFEVADRITMLPATAHQLNMNPVNIVSFTPGTSFELKRGAGVREERAMLRLILKSVWGDECFRSRSSMRVFQGGVSTLEGFRRTFAQVQRDYGSTLDPTLVRGFARVLNNEAKAARTAGEATLLERFEVLCDIFRTDRPVSGWHWREKSLRHQFVGELRDLLARAALEALQPDLIILDEFQRFKHLLTSPGDERFSAAAELAHELFSYVDTDSGRNARVLLLSATPYKMLTTTDEPDEDHHGDFIETVRFLSDNDVNVVEGMKRALRNLRRGLQQVSRDGGVAARSARDEVETTLRRVMVRTERLASEKARGGMLVDRECSDLNLSERDIRSFVAVARIARSLGVKDPIEFWKSGPHLLNFMDGYDIREKFDAASAAKRRSLFTELEEVGLLDWSGIEQFHKLDLDNSRLRWFIDDTVGRGAWKLLWVPPSLPYLEPSGPFAEVGVEGFTKRLVFSAWRLVPTAISTLVSYSAEREMVLAGGRRKYENTPEGRQSRARLLDFSYSSDRLTGMPVLGILYPSAVLAREGDPLTLCAKSRGRVVPQDRALAVVAKRMRGLLDDLVSDIESAGGAVPTEGRADEMWYWAAPLWLDRLDDPAHISEFFANDGRVVRAFTEWDASAGGDRFRQHVARASRTARSEYPSLGGMPKDLPEVLARMALAGPGVTAARALARITRRAVTELDVRFGACKAAWAVRSLFNSPEVIEMVRALHPGDRYWMGLVDYCLAGNLQSILDEYLHVLVSSSGHVDPSTDEALDEFARTLHDTIALRTVNYRVSKITLGEQSVKVDSGTRLRAHFAVRLHEERSDVGGATRVGEVRDAFNSPFWPFILATTSAGQEGLDFHPFCHAIVHWNLPSNPVDLEQREGRVHRFKGHAVRKNLARSFGDVGRSARGDPWERMFETARAARPAGTNDIVPYWVYTGAGEARIERYVPALPLSRDRARAEALKRALATYRLAFGQPRQEDLLAYLAGAVDPRELEQVADELKVNLGP